MMQLNKAAKEALRLLVKSLPGSSILLEALGDDIDAAVRRIFPRKQVTELEKAALDISEALASSSSPFLDRNPGAALSAAHDFLGSLREAGLTLETLVKLEFDHGNAVEYLNKFRPSDWIYASPQRKQIWAAGVSMYAQKLIDFYLSSPRFSGYILAENLRVLNRIARAIGARGQHATGDDLNGN